MHAHTSTHSMNGLHTASASIATLEETASRYGVTSIMLMATYFPLKGTGVHNYDLLGRIKGHPLFSMFGSLDVMNNPDGGLSELTELANASLLAGIKLYPGYQGFEPGDERLDGVYALAEKHNLPVMFHGGELHLCCPPAIKENGPRPCGFDHCKLNQYAEMARPKFVEKPARRHPHVKFVVSHLANPYFSELRGVMKRCPNVFTDISGQFVSGTAEDTAEYRRLIVKEIWRFLVRVPGGYERLMFATDFPIQSYEDSLYLVRSVTGPKHTPLSDGILFGNALRVLDINNRM
jgi:predicted TIM-barrel fold metal-dependent hydrolase